MEQKMKVIVFEGLDGCGKNTQSGLFYQYLKYTYKDIPSYKISLPVYSSPSMFLINQFLKEDKLEDYKDNLSYLKPLSFFMNACLEFFDKDSDILKMMKDGGILVCDRYITSNLLYHNQFDKEHVERINDFIEDLCYEKLQLPIPDIVFYLDITPEMCMKNIEKRGREKDVNETFDYLKKIYNYKDYVIQEYNWYNINCMKNDCMRSVLEIHSQILNIFLKEIQI